MQSSEVEHSKRLRCRSEGASDRDATRSERSRCQLERAIATFLERAIVMPLGARAVYTCVAEEVADNVSVRKPRLQGLAKGKVWRYGGAALLYGTVMGREVDVDCRCCQEVPSAKGIQRDRERIDDVSSNMKTSESLLSASASPCCK